MKKVLIIGFGREATIAHVCTYLKARGTDFDLLDIDELINAEVKSLEIDDADLRLSFGSKSFEFSSYHSFYNRFFYEEGQEQKDAVFLWDVYLTVNAWLMATSKIVINKPYNGLSNSSKFAHILALKDCGFTIPKTFITGSPAFAKVVFEENWSWVSKGCSSHRLKAEKFEAQHYISLDDLDFCPSLFQEFIQGVNVRVHLVGERACALKITSSQVDYRYSPTNEYEMIDLPDEILTPCIRFSQQEKLNFIGFDFIIDKSSTWYILEANPMPGFEYFDQHSNNEIVSMLNDELAREVYGTKLPSRISFIKPNRR